MNTTFKTKKIAWKKVLVDAPFNSAKVSMNKDPWMWNPRLQQGINVINVDEIFNVSNISEDRTYDASTVTVWELANVVWTLIEDFKKINLIK